MMLKSIKIENFRGLKRLEITDFSTINIFVGSNGSGKTSVLEALAVLGSPGNPHLLSNLAAWREMRPMNIQVDYPLRSFFRELNSGIEIKLSAATEKGIQRLSITGQQSDISRLNEPEFNTKSVTGTMQEIEGAAATFRRSAELPFADGNKIAGVSYHFTDEEGTSAMASATLVPVGLQGVVQNVPRALGVFYIQGRRASSVLETAEAITRITEAGEEQPFLQVIRAIEPRCKSIQVGFLGGQTILLADVGGPKRLSISLLGDGFCRACLIATGLVTNGPKLIIVDDIDAGLHHNAMENLWRAIFQICQNRGIQICCSTHNEEMLHAAVAALAESPESLRLIRIDRGKDGSVSSENYDFIHAQIASRNGIEVR